MMQETSPHQNAIESSKEQSRYTYLTRGIVSSADSGQTTGQPEVRLQENAAPTDSLVPVFPSVHGDKYIPPEGSPVLAAPMGKNRYAVVGSTVPDVQTPPLDPGERIISHPLSGATVKFNSDGSIDIAGDSTVRINGGNQGAVVDVQAGDTNSNGGITSLNVIRDNSVLINEAVPI